MVLTDGRRLQALEGISLARCDAGPGVHVSRSPNCAKLAAATLTPQVVFVRQASKRAPWRGIPGRAGLGGRRGRQVGQRDIVCQVVVEVDGIDRAAAAANG